MTTKRSSTSTPGQRSISTFFAPFPNSTPQGSSQVRFPVRDSQTIPHARRNRLKFGTLSPFMQGKAQVAKATVAKRTRTPGTGPSPLSAEPAQNSRSAGIRQKPSPVTGAQAVPSKDIKTRQESAHKQHTSALGQTAVSKRIEVYWDGEQAWWVITLRMCNKQHMDTMTTFITAEVFAIQASCAVQFYGSHRFFCSHARCIAQVLWQGGRMGRHEQAFGGVR